MVVPPPPRAEGAVVVVNNMGKPPLAAKEGASDEKENMEAGPGLVTGLGFSISSRKPPLQMGQTRSEVGEGVRLTVRLHW